MKIHEHHARDILDRYGIYTTAGTVATTPTEAAEAFTKLGGKTAIAKVQVLMGGRGKAGGVKRVASAAEAKAFAETFLGKPFSTYQSAGESKIVRAVLITQDKEIKEEYYLGIAVDRAHGTPVVIFSKEGGVDIEEVAQKNPAAILKLPFKPTALPTKKVAFDLIHPAFPGRAAIADQVAEITERIAKLFTEKDAAIVEINPLSLLEDGHVAALDAKIVFDDNALFRHPEIAAMKDPDEEDQREKKAKSFGLSYVSMTGNVGCLVNGAGLAMATMDMIKRAGGEPANFLDVGGGATADQVREAFKIILQDERVEAILVNIFGGIMKCDVIAEGVIQASREIQLQVPLVVRLEGTSVEEGRALLKNSGLKIISCKTIEEAATAAVKEAATYRKSHVDTHR